MTAEVIALPGMDYEQILAIAERDKRTAIISGNTVRFEPLDAYSMTEKFDRLWDCNYGSAT